jgi:hypothetical protein
MEYIQRKRPEYCSNCKYSQKSLETNEERTKRRFPFHPVVHREVKYGKVHVDHTNITDVVPFTKDAKFIEQKEYRFVLTYTEYPLTIDSFIFCNGIDYMEKCFANPKMRKEQKEELRLIIMMAMSGYGDFSNKKMGDIIANVDDIF